MWCVLCGVSVYCVVLVCTVWCVLCGVSVYCVVCTVYCVVCTVWCVLCGVSVYCVVCTVYCVLCTVWCVLCSSQYNIYSFIECYFVVGGSGCCGGFVAQWLWRLQPDTLGSTPSAAGFLPFLPSPQAGLFPNKITFNNYHTPVCKII